MSRHRYDRRHNPRLLQPPGMRAFVIRDLGGIPGPEGSDTMTYEEIESAFVTEWNRVLEQALGPAWWWWPQAPEPDPFGQRPGETLSAYYSRRGGF